MVVAATPEVGPQGAEAPAAPELERGSGSGTGSTGGGTTGSGGTRGGAGGGGGAAH